MKPFTAAVFDIETTTLEAVGGGMILCAVVKPTGGKPRIFRSDWLDCHFAQEKKLVAALTEQLLKYDVIIGHYADKFDWPYIRTRAMILGYPIPYPRPLSYDTWKAAKRCGFKTVNNSYGKPSASLEMLADLFCIKNRKTSTLPNRRWSIIWEKDKDERVEAMQELVDHCVADVAMTEEVFQRLFEMDSRATMKRLE